MNTEFWQNAWKNSQTGFTQKRTNPMLIEHFKVLNVPKGGRVFVPLCGKSIDILWFLSEGFEVVGVELSEIAVTQFFAENGLQATIPPYSITPNLICYQTKHKGQSLKIWVGNIFDLSSIHVGQIDAIYDRGALVALPDTEPENLRTLYTQKVMELNNTANQLLLSFAYDGKKQRDDKYNDLPPFLITQTQLEQYYANYYDIHLVAREKLEYVSTAGDSGYRLVHTLISKK